MEFNESCATLFTFLRYSCSKARRVGIEVPCMVERLYSQDLLRPKPLHCNDIPSVPVNAVILIRFPRSLQRLLSRLVNILFQCTTNSEHHFRTTPRNAARLKIIPSHANCDFYRPSYRCCCRCFSLQMRGTRDRNSILFFAAKTESLVYPCKFNKETV